MKITKQCLINFDKTLLQILLEGHQYNPDDFRRKQCLTRMMRLIEQSRMLWHENTPYYEDALQQTWVYFCQNIFKLSAIDLFDPIHTSLINWLNQYLKLRLQDFDQDKDLTTVTSSKTIVTVCHTTVTSTNLFARQFNSSILKKTRYWVETDPLKELRKVHILNRPDIHAKALLSKRLLPEKSWREISAEFDSPISTLSSFYQQQCIPLLRTFTREQGLTVQ